MGVLTPRLRILPAAQRKLWEQLGDTPRHFVLYGGTALALRLGHRKSIDFDFFSARPFAPKELQGSINYLANQKTVQAAENTLSCEVKIGSRIVKVSFFGNLKIQQVSVPDTCEGNQISVASLDDLFGTKCATVGQRNASRDYLDIYTIIATAKMPLAHGIACAQAIYREEYDPKMTLTALSYFDDLPEPLTDRVKKTLLAAVQSVSLENLPEIEASATIGARPAARHR